MRATVHDTVGRISSLAWRTLTEKTTVAFEREGSGPYALGHDPRYARRRVPAPSGSTCLRAGRIQMRTVMCIACMCANETVGCARVRYRLLARPVAENPWATFRETVGGIVLTATGGSVIPIAIAAGSPFWLAVGIA